MQRELQIIRGYVGVCGSAKKFYTIDLIVGPQTNLWRFTRFIGKEGPLR